MVAVGVLDAAVQGEFMVRAHVQLERRQPGPFPVVDTFGVLTVALTARLPIAFQQGCSMVGKRAEELRLCNRRDPEASCHRNTCNPLPFRMSPRHRSSPAIDRGANRVPLLPVPRLLPSRRLL